MSEGTKFGRNDSTEFSSQLSTESESQLSAELKATRLGEMSEFEKSLYESGDVAQEQKHNSQKKAARFSEKNEQKSSLKSNLDTEDWSFAQQLEKTIRDYHEGDIVKAIVRSIEKSGVLVDFQYKSDGFIPNNEFSNDPRITPENSLKPGQEVDVFLEKLETKEGYAQLSRKKAEYEIAWNQLLKLSKTKDALHVKVASSVEGGLVVEFRGIKGFVPASHILGEAQDLSGFVGKDLVVTVLNAERKRRKVIFSNRLAKNKATSQEVERIIDQIEIGTKRSGKVSSIKDFGVFVDLGGVEGLVHISELSWARVTHPSEILKAGDAVDVFVLGVDKENHRISLGMKQLQPDPWVKVAEKYQVGQVVTGKITRLATFGAFMQIDRDLEGLIHISELANHRVLNVSDVVKPDQEVTAKIIKLLPAEQKIGLSIKQLEKSKEEVKSAVTESEVHSVAVGSTEE